MIKVNVLIIGAGSATGYGIARATRAVGSLNIRIVGFTTNPHSVFCKSGIWDEIIYLKDSIELIYKLKEYFKVKTAV